MTFLKRINRQLQTVFGGRVRAVEKDGSLVLEGVLDTWEDVVRAGAIVARKKTPALGLVNDINCTGIPVPPMELPAVKDKALEGKTPDVLIIGGGITGCAIARELARYDLDIILAEKEHDLAMHASSRNDGMVHPGLDLRKGTLKYHYNRLGNLMYDRIAGELRVPFMRSGQYLCFNSPLIIPVLYLSLLYWKWMKVPGVQVLGRKALHRREPGLRNDLGAALFFPNAGVVCPHSLTIAYGENAVQNGVSISLDTAVLGMKLSEEGRRINEVVTNRGTLYPQVVINAAGVFADEVAAMGGDRFYSIHPRKGSSAILDKKVLGRVVTTIASKKGRTHKTDHTKWGGIIRTVHGNLLVGPDAAETRERENFATCAASIEKTIEKFQNTSLLLSQSQIITYFTGIRAATYEEDFVVCKGKRTANLVHAAGIQSPGLTAAPAIALDVVRFTKDILTGAGFQVRPNRNFNPNRVPIPHVAAMGDDERDALIRTNPDYGIILCRCEEVSKGEILDSLRRPVPCDTVDGVKRRVRPGAGRCQGGFCGPLVLRLIAQEKNIPPEAVTKSGGDSFILTAANKIGRM
jgi:glycerol-3-phosphate dehydrogenase